MKGSQQMNISGLILEGISGTGKTSLLTQILTHPYWRNKNGLSSVVLSEHQTQRVLERKGREEGLELKDHLDLLDRHVTYLEGLNSQLEQMEWCRKGQTSMRIPYVLERFHLTHVIDYPHVDWNHLQVLDSRLAALNGRLILLTASPAALEQRLFTGRDENWMNYIQRFGSTQTRILDHFLKRQEQLKSLAKKTSLKVTLLDSSALKAGDLAEQVLPLLFT